MASTVASDKLFANQNVVQTHHAPGDTEANVVGWRDLSGYGGYAVSAMLSTKVGTGITAMQIVAADDASGTHSTVIKQHAVGSAPDALGDTLVLECIAEEIAALSAAAGYALRYVGAKLTLNNAGDEIAVTEIRWSPRFAQDGLTADVVAA